MENKLPQDGFRPQDEYPALNAKPIEAAEPAFPQEPASGAQAAAQPSAPAQPPTAAPAPGVQPQQSYQQNTAIPYYTYPIYPPIPGMPQYPQQQYSQQQYPQQPVQQQYPQQQYQTPTYQQYPFRYPDYTPYFAPNSQQQPTSPAGQQAQGYARPAAPAAQQPMPQQPARQPIAPAMNPQGYQAPPQQNPVPEYTNSNKTSTGTKAFLIILSALLVAMVAGFIVYVITAANNDVAKNKGGTEDLISSIEKDDPLINIPEFENELDDIELKHSETEEEITLVADDGATQKRDNDNPESVGKPDKNAPGITLDAPPKDAATSQEYTAKSAFNKLADSVVTITCYKETVTDKAEDQVSGGSGTIISADGYIVTNAHVLYNSKQFAVSVTLNDGKKYQAKIVGYDTWTDLAVLKIDAKDLKPAAFGDSETVEVGDDVITIGSPGGAKFQNTLTQGVVSALDREISTSKFVRYIQSDAAINPGSSGGPLCNLYGQVVGITTAKTVAQNFENMSFSIPSALVKDIVTDLLHYGYVPNRPRIGFSGNEVPAEYRTYYGLPSGVIINEIADDGALKDSSVEEGDIITAIDGESITSFQDIYNILAKHKAGDKLKLSIYRIEEKGFFDEESPIE